MIRIQRQRTKPFFDVGRAPPDGLEPPVDKADVLAWYAEAVGA